MSAVAVHSEAVIRRRNLRFGLFSLLLAAVMLGFFAPGSGGSTARFIVDATRGGVPPLRVSVFPTVTILGVVVLALAAYMLVRGFGERALLVLGLATGLFVFAFLTWAAAEQSLSLIGLLRSTLFSATPIAFGALAGVLGERAGVINIAIEGQFLAAAFTGAVVGSVTSSSWIGLLGGIAAGVLIAAMLAGLSITFKADQIVSGVVLIVFATGLTSFLTSQVLSGSAGLNRPPRFGSWAIPGLSEIPVVGPLLFTATPLTFAMLIAVIWLQFALFRTRWGLRLRAVGEKPRAADTVGIPVIPTRWKAVLYGGVLAGMGGAWFTLDSVGSFSREMTGGRGFIALAALLVGRYSPLGAFGAALLFGFATAMASALQLLSTGVPSSLLLTIPYIVTIFVVAGLMGRLRAPAADGQPYEKE
ncbi:MAG TPA: ABC transporter permease [Egicoccus sp.]|nr:ABC transporter permease [Egicoccus sp.]HSK24841.1 ABC transporter permease [Egicoccus sp.]